MDELDQLFPQFLLQRESQRIYYLSELQSLPQHKEQTFIDTRQQEQEPHQDNEEDKKKRSRDDNTIFKTPLSEFRKIMKEILKPNKQCLEILDQINKKKNTSTFLKFLLLSQHVGIKSKLKEPFQSRMQKILMKKKPKLSENRFQELQKIYLRMKSTLECDKISDATQQYWGRYRQKTKYSESQKEIQNFRKFLETKSLIMEKKKLQYKSEL